MSENYEKITPADIEQPEVTEAVEEAAAQEINADGEVELELDELNEGVNPEAEMTTGQKIKTLLMKPLWSSIVKWSFIFLGLAALVLYLIVSNGDRATGESFAKAFSGVSNGLASFFSMIPVSMFEILICAAAVGIFAYLVFIVVRTIQVKGKFRKAGLWVQFGYTLLAVASVFAILLTLCYGMFTNRERLSKNTDYTSGKVSNMHFSEAMLYLIDGINNSLNDGSNSIYFNKAGQSKYATSGRSTEEITKKVVEAFDAAAVDIPTLKGAKLSTKELIFTELYTSNQISSIYSPFTGELCINTDYPEIIIPMQVAKTMAMQRGYTDDGDASFIAFLVCTQYSDDYYIRYSGYFNAYLELSTACYKNNGKNLHMYLANALKDSAKREFVELVKDLDTLYGLSSDIEYIQSSDELNDAAYGDVAKLLLVEFRDLVDSGKLAVDSTEKVDYGKFCNYLTNYYLIDSEWANEVDYVYDEYHPTR